MTAGAAKNGDGRVAVRPSDPIRGKEGPSAIMPARLDHDKQHDANAGVKQVEKKILAIDVVNVALIGVSPTYRPCINDVESIAAVLKAGLAFHSGWLVDRERMLAPEVRSKLIVGNMTAPLAAARYCCLAASDESRVKPQRAPEKPQTTALLRPQLQSPRR